MPRRRLTFLLAPRWLALHVLVLAVSVTMVLLGRWQLDVATSRGWPLQNSAYAFQWWAFTAFVLFFWAKVIYDAATGKAEAARKARDRQTVAEALEPVAYRRYVLPRNTALPVSEAERAAYLAGRTARDELPGTHGSGAHSSGVHDSGVHSSGVHDEENDQ